MRKAMYQTLLALLCVAPAAAQERPYHWSDGIVDRAVSKAAAETDAKIDAAVEKLRKELKAIVAAPVAPQSATMKVGDWVVTATVDAKGALTLTAKGGPKPGPTPPTPPDPTPPTPVPPEPSPPGPVVPTKLVVVIVEETAEAVATRGAFLADKSLADFMTTKGHRWRVVDKDVVGPPERTPDGKIILGPDGKPITKPPPDVVRFLDKAKAAKLPTLFLVDPKGKTVHEGPVPATAAELVALLKKWGGE